MIDSKKPFKIVARQLYARGEIFRIDINEFIIEIMYTHHALGRIKQWGLSPESVSETLIFPEEVIYGHRDRYIAHKRYGNHLIRAVYEYDAALPVLITVYYPRYDRYFEGGEKYADKIFQGL